MTDNILQDVSDTALWVAVYRARESERPDAIFKDPFARKLAGKRGEDIEKQMSTSKYVSWSVIIRTHIIDGMIQKLVNDGVDTVINLGAGLDTRPYRMFFSKSIKWIEIDFPKMVEYKKEKLAQDTPRCDLERIGLDLSREEERRTLFADLNSRCQKALILTEGVTPYLTNEAVASLAKDIRAQSHFCYWITDYNSPELTKYLKSPKRMKEMKNAPFVFDPPDWMSFYENQGWKRTEIQYIGEQAEVLHRPPPHPLFVKFIQAVLVPKETLARYKRFNGYALLEPK